ncbi:MAG: haloacid dehalogenase type II [Burkholderiales bacterium]|nr:haloacid dehalogenase type II [Burkholderiales bacterium]
MQKIDALVFDVFGTVVDWRGSITREGRALGERKNIKFNWARFANAWRAGYAPAMDRVRHGELAWMNIDQLHRLILDELLVKFNIDGLKEEDKDYFNRVWHRLKPWPDSVRGLKRLKKKFVIATLSNGNMSLLTNMAKNAGLPWDCIISAELFHHYKPDPQAYEGAAKMLGFPRERVMLVAAHKDDLRAAQQSGLRAAFVARPKEFPPSKKLDLSPDSSFDYNATSFTDLADQLGV